MKYWKCSSASLRPRAAETQKCQIPVPSGEAVATLSGDINCEQRLMDETDSKMIKVKHNYYQLFQLYLKELTFANIVTLFQSGPSDFVPDLRSHNACRPGYAEESAPWHPKRRQKMQKMPRLEGFMV